MIFLIWRIDYDYMTTMREDPEERTLLGYAKDRVTADDVVARMTSAHGSYDGRSWNVSRGRYEEEKFPKYDIIPVDELR